MSTTTTTTTVRSAPLTMPPIRLSGGCQQVVHEDFTDPRQATVTVRSTLTDPELWPQIENHKCHNVALTPSGLYADMAMTVAGHIWRYGWRGPDAELPGFDVRDLLVTKTLIAGGRQQWFEMECTLSIPPGSSGDIIDGIVHCQFRETSATGVKMHDLASCTVRYGFTYGWQAEWAHHAPLIKSKIRALHSRASSPGGAGDTMHVVHKQKAYELFSTFVAYGPKYQNMSSVTYDTSTLEGTSTLSFVPTPATDTYIGPYHLDGSCHLSGFLCNTAIDSSKWAYISHGIDGVKMTQDFDPTRMVDGRAPKIENYVQMRPVPGDETVMRGDVWILQEGEIVGLWEAVRFKRIPRKVLAVFLPQPK